MILLNCLPSFQAPGPAKGAITRWKVEKESILIWFYKEGKCSKEGWVEKDNAGVASRVVIIFFPHKQQRSFISTHPLKISFWRFSAQTSKPCVSYSHLQAFIVGDDIENGPEWLTDIISHSPHVAPTTNLVPRGQMPIEQKVVGPRAKIGNMASRLV